MNDAGRRVIQVQSQGWPDMDCPVSLDEISATSAFLDESVECTADDCVRIELTEQAYDRFEGRVRFSNVSSLDVAPGVFDRSAQRWGTKRTLLTLGLEAPF